jgi:hypothetical protein
MTKELEIWLRQATRHLSRKAAAQVRNEIGEHYDAARQGAMERGCGGAESDRVALEALGDARAANRQYRKVMLTSGEARLLREGNWEAAAVCNRAWLKWLLLAMPASALLAGIGLLLFGATVLPRILLVGGMGIGLLFAASFLPVYTPARSRVFRIVKWIMLTALLALAFWPMTPQWSWLMFSSLWPVVWIEWKRVSIRRKLPVSKWPKQLYL